MTYTKSIICLLAIMISFSDLVRADVDYCNDDSTRIEWERMIIDYPDDTAVLHLAGLHYGLCMMIDKGQISRDKAIDIFESAKGGAIKRRFTEQVLSKNTDKEI